MKWFLIYTYTNEMEAGTFRDGVEDEEIVLNASTENEAIIEAGTKWDDVLAKSIARWEEQKKTWKHPPASPSEWGARNPRIIYRITL